MWATGQGTGSVCLTRQWRRLITPVSWFTNTSAHHSSITSVAEFQWLCQQSRHYNRLELSRHKMCFSMRCGCCWSCYCCCCLFLAVASIEENWWSWYGVLAYVGVECHLNYDPRVGLHVFAASLYGFEPTRVLQAQYKWIYRNSAGRWIREFDSVDRQGSLAEIYA